MTIRITRLRLAAAGLFVLAGVGLASILSPLVGSAFATAGQIVNISDATAANTAHVDSAGELKTNGSVTGTVAPTLPRGAFDFAHDIRNADGQIPILGPTTATVALTSVKVSNPVTQAGGERLNLVLVSAPAPNTTCAASRLREALGAFDVPLGDTVSDSLPTPAVLKPLAAGDAWCLLADVFRVNTSTDVALSVAFTGYVPSGTFVPPASPGAQVRRTLHRR